MVLLVQAVHQTGGSTRHSALGIITQNTYIHNTHQIKVFFSGCAGTPSPSPLLSRRVGYGYPGTGIYRYGMGGIIIIYYCIIFFYSIKVP